MQVPSDTLDPHPLVSALRHGTAEGQALSAPNGCLGKCCVLIELGNDHSLAELQATSHLDFDRARIADMLIPLDADVAQERAERFRVIPEGAKLAAGIEWYACRHWDEETGLCREYDLRPKMCRDYPYAGEACEYPDCCYRA